MTEEEEWINTPRMTEENIGVDFSKTRRIPELKVGNVIVQKVKEAIDFR